MPKTIVITGTSSGIGKATAIYFSNNGWNVAATMRMPEDEKELDKIPNIKLYKLDVSENSSVQKAIEKIIDDYKVIDVLVNNAGYAVDGVFEEIDDETIQKQFNTNVFGLMRVTRAIIPHMRKNRKGIIVQIASMGGRLSFPLYSIYHATKWAVEGFNESLQYELNQFNIKLKIIEPGTVNTEFYGKSRQKIETKITDYEQLVAKCEKVSQPGGKNGIKPEEIAKTIYQEVIENNNNLRRTIGYPAPQLLFFRRVLPERWFFKIVKIAFRI